MKTRHEILLGILFFALAVHAFILYSYQYVWWDSGVYIAMAKHLYSYGHSGFWENIRPPLLPILMGPLWLLYLPFPLFARVFVVFFSMGSLLLTYRIGKQLFNWQTGLIACALLAASNTYLFVGSQVLSDVPSIFLSLLGVYLLLQEYDFLSGLCIGFAFLTRFPQGFILVTASFYLFILWIRHQETFSRAFKRGVRVVSGFVIPAGIYLITNKVFFQSYFGPLQKAMEIVRTAPPNFVDVKFFYLTHLFLENILFLFAFIALYQLLKKKNYAILALLALPVLFYFPYFALKPSREVRYLLILLPYLYLLAARGLHHTLEKRRRTLFITVLLSMVLGVILLQGWFSIYLTDFGPYDQHEYQEVLTQYYPLVNQSYVLTSNPSVAAFTDHKILVMYRMPFDEAYGKYFRRTDVKYAYLNECDLQCPEGNERCVKDREEFIGFMTHNNLLLNKTFGRCRYYVIKKV
ncbi:MAG: glycosyltransferase family 39 protein [Nanoarchaeota archaeon]